MLSALVLTHNNEKTIEKCLSSLEFCSEILIIDDFSTDKTLELAKKFNGNILFRKLENDFSSQRNYGLSNAKNDWEIFVDADEVVTPELSNEIIETLKNPKYESYKIPRSDIFWDKKLVHGELEKASKYGFIRLIKKGSGKWTGKVHEKYISTGQSGQLTAHLLHYPHQTVSEYLSEINYYSTIRMNELIKQGKKISIFEVVSIPILKFFYTFFAKGGYKDREEGFIYSFMMSFHSFLVRSKLYLHYIKVSRREKN